MKVKRVWPRSFCILTCVPAITKTSAILSLVGVSDKAASCSGVLPYGPVKLGFAPFVSKQATISMLLCITAQYKGDSPSRMAFISAPCEIRRAIRGIRFCMTASNRAVSSFSWALSSASLTCSDRCRSLFVLSGFSVAAAAVFLVYTTRCSSTVLHNCAGATPVFFF